ncbi:hypothetical protein R1flu_017788 [Riccia fluitans]|uniref:Uncharacterized protein n=1 Tax=Riccia fluitans TaxID=41844 RepID=A0ABD1ZE88_9MARC
MEVSEGLCPFYKALLKTYHTSLCVKERQKSGDLLLNFSHTKSFKGPSFFELSIKNQIPGEHRRFTEWKIC